MKLSGRNTTDAAKRRLTNSSSVAGVGKASSDATATADPIPAPTRSVTAFQIACRLGSRNQSGVTGSEAVIARAASAPFMRISPSGHSSPEEASRSAVGRSAVSSPSGPTMSANLCWSMSSTTSNDNPVSVSAADKNASGPSATNTACKGRRTPVAPESASAEAASGTTVPPIPSGSSTRTTVDVMRPSSSIVATRAVTLFG